MIVTAIPSNIEQQQVMQGTLTSGQWFVDNNKLPEQTSLSHRVSFWCMSQSDIHHVNSTVNIYRCVMELFLAYFLLSHTEMKILV